MSYPAVAVNLRSVGAGLHGGVPRYVNEVVPRIAGLEPIVPPSRCASGALGHAWEQIVLPRRLARGQLLWSPGNFGPAFHSAQVVSIYDVAPIDHPGWFGDRYAKAFAALTPRLARRCRHILTISEFSKQRIAAVCDVPESKITVAEPGVSDAFAPDPTVERTDDLLVVAGPDPRKNLRRVVEAFERIAEAVPSRRLVIVTGDRAAGVFSGSDLPDHPRIDVVFDPSDDELRHLYRTAGAVVSAPLYEGYGLPAAESLACGAPLIVSDIGAHAHAIPHAAAVVDPTNVENIAEAFHASPSFEPSSTWVRPSWQRTADVISRTLDQHR